MSSVQYDKTGNIVQDSVNGQVRNFVFNGDNKQVHVKDANNQPIGTYFYDGNGARVKKSTASETTIFVYDASSKLVAEYSTATPPTNPTVSYTATDTLGSPRVITDKQGNVTSRRDFLPFGEEVNPDANFRKTAFKYGYGSDNVRKRFTGYEKDDETGLDFAQARYYNNKHGRFTAVDPLLASGKSGNPQSFNRYAYTMNQPLTMIDPTGLQTETTTKIGEFFVDVTDSIAKVPEHFEKFINKSSEMITRQFSYGGDTVGFRERIPIFDKLAGPLTSYDPLENANYRANQNLESALAGDQESANFLNLKIFGNKGSTYTSVLDKATLDKERATFVAETSVQFQMLWLGLNPASSIGAASTVSTNRSISSNGFAEKLFTSKSVGKESSLFGNSRFDMSGNGREGLLNQSGSIAKLGWSTPLRGGGYQFRLGLLTKPNSRQALFHFNVPKTFVPNSFSDKFQFRAPPTIKTPRIIVPRNFGAN